MCIRDRPTASEGYSVPIIHAMHPLPRNEKLTQAIQNAVSYTHLDVYKRQVYIWKLQQTFTTRYYSYCVHMLRRRSICEFCEA